MIVVAVMVVGILVVAAYQVFTGTVPHMAGSKTLVIASVAGAAGENATSIQPIRVELVRGVQIVLGDGSASQSPEDRNVAVICYGRTGDKFAIQYHPDAPELWIERADGTRQMLEGAIVDPVSGELLPVDIFWLVDENKDPIGWIPTWMEPSLPSAPSTGV